MSQQAVPDQGSGGCAPTELDSRVSHSDRGAATAPSSPVLSNTSSLSSAASVWATLTVQETLNAGQVIGEPGTRLNDATAHDFSASSYTIAKALPLKRTGFDGDVTVDLVIRQKGARLDRTSALQFTIRKGGPRTGYEETDKEPLWTDGYITCLTEAILVNGLFVTKNEEVLVPDHSFIEGPEGEWAFKLDYNSEGTQPPLYPRELGLFCPRYPLGDTQSSTYRAFLDEDRADLVVKVYGTDRLRDWALKEIDLLQALEKAAEHKLRYIVTAFQLIKQRDSYMVMSFCGDLTVATLGRIFPEGLPEAEGARFASQALSGLLFLRQQHVIHRRLSPCHVVIHPETLVLTITGFREAVYHYKESIKADIAFGVTGYNGPEVLSRGRYSFALDMWTMTLVIAEGLTGCRCQSLEESCTTPEAVEAAFPTWMESFAALVAHLSLQARDFLMLGLRIAPEERHTFIQISKHPFLHYSMHTDDIVSTPNSVVLEQETVDGSELPTHTTEQLQVEPTGRNNLEQPEWGSSQALDSIPTKIRPKRKVPVRTRSYTRDTVLSVMHGDPRRAKSRVARRGIR